MYYTNNSGRNDIVGAKVARDQENIWFYVETAGELSPQSDPHWMQLLIDVDRDKSTGWNGYDFIINRVSPKGRKAVMERNIQGIWMWEKSSECEFRTFGNKLVIKIPRKALGLSS